jgi:hypothetical protein
MLIRNLFDDYSRVIWSLFVTYLSISRDYLNLIWALFVIIRNQINANNWKLHAKLFIDSQRPRWCCFSALSRRTSPAKIPSRSISAKCLPQPRDRRPVPGGPWLGPPGTCGSARSSRRCRGPCLHSRMMAMWEERAWHRNTHIEDLLIILLVCIIYPLPPSKGWVI